MAKKKIIVAGGVNAFASKNVKEYSEVEVAAEKTGDDLEKILDTNTIEEIKDEEPEEEPDEDEYPDDEEEDEEVAEEEEVEEDTEEESEEDSEEETKDNDTF